MYKYLLISVVFLSSIKIHAQFKDNTYDALQYTSSFAYLSSSVFDKNADFKTDMTNFGFSYLTMATTVIGLKRLTHIQRPDLSDFNSFPSGHAAVSFMGAELMRSKYKKNPELWVSAYGLATLVAVQRIQDNHHRPLEVISGALIGVASVHLGKLFLNQLKSKKRKQNILTN